MSKGHPYKDEIAARRLVRGRHANNKAQIEKALTAVYATKITDEKVAKSRGEAVQALNRFARLAGFPELARND